MPLRIVPGATTDLDRFLYLGLPSLVWAIPPEMIHEFVVVTPANDREIVARALEKRHGMRFRILDEDTYLSSCNLKAGWFKQQVIKLNAFNVVETDWVLMLDADIIACRPVTIDELFTGGRAVVHREPASAHPEWWHGSAKLLGITPLFQGDDLAMGVTPQLLHVPTLKSLALKLSEIARGEPWQAFLLRKDITALCWTEYSLYWTYVAMTGIGKDLYSDETFSMYGSSIWGWDDWTRLAKEDVSDMLHRSGQLFLVVQSRLGLNISDVLPALSLLVHRRQTTPLELKLFKVRELAGYFRARASRQLRRMTVRTLSRRESQARLQ